MYKPITMVFMGLTRYKAMIEHVMFNSVMGILTRVCVCLCVRARVCVYVCAFCTVEFSLLVFVTALS